MIIGPPPKFHGTRDNLGQGPDWGQRSSRVLLSSRLGRSLEESRGDCHFVYDALINEGRSHTTLRDATATAHSNGRGSSVEVAGSASAGPPSLDEQGGRHGTSTCSTRTRGAAGHVPAVLRRRLGQWLVAGRGVHRRHGPGGPRRAAGHRPGLRRRPGGDRRDAGDHRRTQGDVRAQGEGLLPLGVRYGSFSRTVPLPAGATEADIHASHTDGVLEVRVPTGEKPEKKTVKVPITRG